MVIQKIYYRLSRTVRVFIARCKEQVNRTHLGLHQPLGCLDLGFTERPPVLGTDVRPHCQVGGFLQSLGGRERGRLGEYQLWCAALGVEDVPQG